MTEFRIKVARIESSGQRKQQGEVCITFQVDGGPLHFKVPVPLNSKDFDDTEMVRAARHALHRAFAELTLQSRNWKLTGNDLRRLSRMSLRPNP
ncbi:MAG: hypothetical protein ACJ8F3_11200 [Xanthobacteraceae bacterium]